MKVIIIKKCKDGDINDIIDVSNGYAKNFLIKNNFAKPINLATMKLRANNIAIKNNLFQKNLKISLEAKKIIENLKLEFKLKTTNDVVHGSITKKQIHNELRKQKIHVESHDIENIKIKSLGTSIVKVKLYKDIIANLVVEVKDEK